MSEPLRLAPGASELASDRFDEEGKPIHLSPEASEAWLKRLRDTTEEKPDKEK